MARNWTQVLQDRRAVSDEVDDNVAIGSSPNVPLVGLDEDVDAVPEAARVDDGVPAPKAQPAVDRSADKPRSTTRRRRTKSTAKKATAKKR